MADYEALLHFNRAPVSPQMVDYLAATTASIVQIKHQAQLSAPELQPPSLSHFIQQLISHSNVQTPTLMATTVYLSKLRSIIPGNIYGIETTRHRIFLGCLILAAKTLNDSSPMNKHWAKYTNGLLPLREVNTIERELLEYFDWNVTITTQELIHCLQPFLKPIASTLTQQKLQRQVDELMMFNSSMTRSVRDHGKNSLPYSSSSLSNSNVSIPSLASSNTISTTGSMRSMLSRTKYETIDEEKSHGIPGKKMPLSSINANNVNESSLKTRPLILKSGNENAHPKSHLKRSNWLNFLKP